MSVVGPVKELRAGLDEMPSVELDRNLLFDFMNLARGVYSPLTGFLTRNDFRKVVYDMTLESGIAWPLPVVLDVDAETANDLGPGDRIGLRGPGGVPIGVMDVDDVYR